MRRTARLMVLGAAASLMLMASPAQAAPPTSVWEPAPTETFTEPLPPMNDPDFTEFCGFTPEHPVVHTFTQDVEVFEQLRGSDFPYFASRGTSTDVYTNPDTGETFTISNTFFAKDVRIVDNGDGTITIRFTTNFEQRVYGSEGELLYVDRGHLQDAVVIDYNGTPGDPSDDEFVDAVVDAFRIVGHLETENRDFCEDFLAATS